MSFFRQLPEFIRATKFVKTSKWYDARSQFERCAEIMSHANQYRDSSIANLYAGTCCFYTGDIAQASSLFKDSFSNLSSRHGLADSASKTAYEFLLSAEFESHVKDQSRQYPAQPSPTEYAESDSWIQLSLGKSPRDGFAKAVWDYAESSVELLDPPSSAKEYEAVAWAQLKRAYSAVSLLPKANASGVSIEREVKLVNLALKAGERVKSLGDEYDVASSWYVGYSLLLRGQLFEFNANALMAEGMYRAAADLVDKSAILIPRKSFIKATANHRLGDLLKRWERREQEGERLLNANALPDAEVTESIIHTFVSFPHCSTLDNLDAS